VLELARIHDVQRNLATRYVFRSYCVCFGIENTRLRQIVTRAEARPTTPVFLQTDLVCRGVPHRGQ
jgi:hypothetical protein